MSVKTKTFDCVALKTRVQAALAEERARLGEDRLASEHRRWLETSTDALAVWWREGRQPNRET